ncbi:MAG: TolC family protein [Candidatus Latescibacteria bacterium]|nr:TolC family protein [Candidatus Latescibacterota bacterium]
MKTMRNWLPLLAVMLFASDGTAQERLGLSDAIGRALDHNYSIRVVRRREEIAGINDSWGAAGRLPTVDFTLSANNRMDFNETADVASNSLTPGVALNWVLFNGFSIRVAKERLKTLAELSQGNTAVLVEQTVQSVVLTYYRALLEQEMLDVLREVMELSEDRYGYTVARKEVGQALTFDVLQAKNAWLEDKAAFLRQEVSLANAVRDLNYLMGMEGETAYVFSDDFTAELNDYDLPALRSKLLASNKTLRNQYINETLLEKDKELARSRYWPSVSLRTGLDAAVTRRKFEGLDADTQNSRDAYANVTLRFSLFDGGARKRALQVARIQEEIGGTQTEDMVHSLTVELAKLFDLYEVRKDLFMVAEENLDAARLNREISEDRFRAGTINSFNYRDVQLIYLRAALSRLQAIYNLIDTDTALARITGGIVTEY